MTSFESTELINYLNPLIRIVLLFSISIPSGFFVAWLYQKTYKGISYSQTFSITLVLLTVITTFIILIIQDNIARAVGIFGAFSIIRFRTAIKDPRDIAFAFFALAVGMSIGAGHLLLGISSTMIIGILIYFIHKINFGGFEQFDYIVNLKINSEHYSNDVFKAIFEKYLHKQSILTVDTKKTGKYLIFTFYISLKKKAELNEFIEKITDILGVDEVNFVSAKSGVGY